MSLLLKQQRSEITVGRETKGLWSTNKDDKRPVSESSLWGHLAWGVESAIFIQGRVLMNSMGISASDGPETGFGRGSPPKS